MQYVRCSALRRVLARRSAAALLAAGAVLAAGCEAGPPAGAPPADPAEPPPPRVVVAVEPVHRAEGVGRRPRFRWKLPPALGSPDLVSLTLVEVGRAEDPEKPESAPRQVAFASGLHDTSPTALDPFDPPRGCVLTGELTDLKELRADTWYRWVVRAIAGTDSIEGTFLFRTQGDAGPPAAPPPEPPTSAPPPPDPRP